jgi:hypothetical protein
VTESDKTKISRPSSSLSERFKRRTSSPKPLSSYTGSGKLSGSGSSYNYKDTRKTLDLPPLMSFDEAKQEAEKRRRDKDKDEAKKRRGNEAKDVLDKDDRDNQKANSGSSRNEKKDRTKKPKKTSKPLKK